MQFAHGKGYLNDYSPTDFFLASQGVSATTGRPFSPPLSYRTSNRRHALKLERSEILEGRCHKCKKWVPVESIKDCEVKV